MEQPLIVVGVMAQKPLLAQLSPLEAVGLATCVTAFLWTFAVLQAWDPPGFSWSGVGGMLYAVVVATFIGYSLSAFANRVLLSSTLLALTALQPVTTELLAALLLGEKLTAFTVAATVAIVGAIVLLAADLRNVESHAPLQEIDMQQKEDGNEPPRGIGVEMVEVGINGNAVGRGIG